MSALFRSNWLLPSAMSSPKLPARLVALIKPQFEGWCERREKGVVRDPALHGCASAGDIARVCHRARRWRVIAVDSLARSKAATDVPNSCLGPRCD